MIELGRLSILNSDLVIEVRRKIRLLAESLKLPDIVAVRLEVAFSEIGRAGCRNGNHLEVTVGIEPASPSSLIVQFRSRANLASVPGIIPVFSTKSERNPGIRDNLLTVRKFLPTEDRL
jgi:hypothetical protein